MLLGLSVEEYQLKWFLPNSINELPRQEQFIFILHYYENFTFDVISVTLNMPIQEVINSYLKACERCLNNLN